MNVLVIMTMPCWCPRLQGETKTDCSMASHYAGTNTHTRTHAHSLSHCSLSILLDPAQTCPVQNCTSATNQSSVCSHPAVARRPSCHTSTSSRPRHTCSLSPHPAPQSCCTTTCATCPHARVTHLRHIAPMPPRPCSPVPCFCSHFNHTTPKRKPVSQPDSAAMAAAAPGRCLASSARS